MVQRLKNISAMVLRLMVGLALLGWPKIGYAVGTWSVIAPEGSDPGHVRNPGALAVDTAGNVYVADGEEPVPLGGVTQDRIQKRDAQGNWSVIATRGSDTGQVSNLTALALDAVGNLYVAAGGSFSWPSRIQKRDAQGNWSIVASEGEALGQVHGPTALAVDTADNLYIADFSYDPGTGYSSRIQKQDVQGNWSVIAAAGTAAGQILGSAQALAVDAGGNLYVADAGVGYSTGRIQKRDDQGKWSIVLRGLDGSSALAVDATGNLYLADYDFGIQKLDAQGNWSVISTQYSPSDIAVDAAGHLYVSDIGNNWVLEYTPGP